MAAEPFATANDATTALLERALELALPERAAPRPPFRTTRARTMNRRGILWLGQTCNLRCRFCYYLDRVENARHPQHAFMSLEKAKRICDVLVGTYGNTSVDIQGGEPTLFPEILSLVAHCRAIGLAPTIITNGIRLAEPGLADAYRAAGLRDFIVSVQGLGPVYDDLVGRRGAHEFQMIGLANLQAAGVRFRFNCVLSRPVLSQLSAIAELGVRTGAFVVNFLALNLFDDQSGDRSAGSQMVPPYSEIAPHLDAALDVLAAAGVEGNARYLPLCVVAPRHRIRCHTFHQVPYDLHENDFASWSWTGLDAQRTREGELSPPLKLGARVKLGMLRRPLRAAADSLGGRDLLRRLEAGVNTMLSSVVGNSRRWSKESLYLAESRRRAHDFCGYTHPPPCRQCDLQPICDGVPADVVRLHGISGIEPVRMGRKIQDPRHLINEQDKVVHPEDEALLGTREPA